MSANSTSQREPGSRLSTFTKRGYRQWEGERRSKFYAKGWDLLESAGEPAGKKGVKKEPQDAATEAKLQHMQRKAWGAVYDSFTYSEAAGGGR